MFFRIEFTIAALYRIDVTIEKLDIALGGKEELLKINEVDIGIVFWSFST
jgi:hypothetical protein